MLYSSCITRDVLTEPRIFVPLINYLYDARLLDFTLYHSYILAWTERRIIYRLVIIGPICRFPLSCFSYEWTNMQLQNFGYFCIYHMMENSMSNNVESLNHITFIFVLGPEDSIIIRDILFFVSVLCDYQ